MGARLGGGCCWFFGKRFSSAGRRTGWSAFRLCREHHGGMLPIARGQGIVATRAVGAIVSTLGCHPTQIAAFQRLRPFHVPCSEQSTSRLDCVKPQRNVVLCAVELPCLDFSRTASTPPPTGAVSDPVLHRSFCPPTLTAFRGRSRLAG